MNECSEFIPIQGKKNACYDSIEDITPLPQSGGGGG